MVHVPAKFRENTSMRFRVTVRKLNMTDRRTDGRTDGGRCNIFRPRAYGTAGDKNTYLCYFLNKYRVIGGENLSQTEYVLND